MPSQGRHNHFANNKQSPERERRLLGFANEPADEFLKRYLEMERILTARITTEAGAKEEAMRAEFENRVSRVTLPAEIKKLLERVSQSPSLTKTIIEADVLPETERSRLETLAVKEDPSLTRPVDVKVITAYLNGHPEEAEKAREILERELGNLRTSIRFARAYELKVDRYRELSEMIESKLDLCTGSVDYEKVVELSLHLDQQAQEHPDDPQYATGFTGWLEKTPFSEICERLDIDPNAPKFERKTEDDPAIRWAHEQIEALAQEQPSLTTRVWNTIQAGWKRATKQSHDMDDEESEEFKEATYEELRKSAGQLKEYLDKQLQAEAEERLHFFNDQWTQLKKEIDEGKIPNASLEAVNMTFIDYIDRLRVIQRTAVNENSLVDDNPVSTNDEAYFSHVSMSLRYFEELDDIRIKGENARMFILLEAEETMAQGLRWARAEAERFEALAKKLKGGEIPHIREMLGEGANAIIKMDKEKVFERLRKREENDEDKQMILQQLSTTSIQQELSKTLDLALQPHHPIMDELAGLPALRGKMEGENTPEACNELIRELREIKSDLLSNPLLDNKVCNIKVGNLDIRSRLEEEFVDLLADLHRAGKEDTNERYCLAVQRMNKLRECRNLLKKEDTKTIHGLTEEKFEETKGNIVYLSAEQYMEKAEVDSLAYYSHAEDAIFVNEERIRNENLRFEDIINHEQGHRLLHIFVRRTKLFPDLLSGIARGLSQEVTSFGGEEVSYMQLLEKVGKEWGVDKCRDALLEHELKRAMKETRGDRQRAKQLADERTDQNMHEFLVDEFLNQYATWETVGLSRPTSEIERLLLNSLKKDEQPTVEQSSLEKYDSEKREEALTKLYMPAAPTASDASEDINQELRDAKRLISNLRDFYASHSEFHGTIFGQDLELVDRTYKRMYDEYIDTGSLSSGFEDLKNFLGLLKEVMDTVDTDDLDVSDEKPSGSSLWRKVSDNVGMMSVNDVISMFKSMGEDISRMWKRRGEAIQSQVGLFVTGWVPGFVPYIGRLKNEFRRRWHASELEEVNQWKETLKEIDNWELQDMIAKVKNKDQLRAMLELLSEKGRLDWNDVNLWHTLNRLSRFKMPIEACKRSDIVRDKWLQKLISDIWTDKDHYHDWRQANDSGIEGSKKKFTQTADQFANISGGLQKALEKQLELYVRRRGTGNMSEDVNPHLYEEILHYAIRNGKMLMEHKFFFLIQGVRYGLLSIDRLRALAGEHGGVLNIFPYIDYFYQKNNSLADVTRLGESLEEPAHRFRPGIKTILFVRDEIGREQAVKERLRKGVSKQGENIDHDDIPYFLPDLDYSGISEWLCVYSGHRQKLSKEALKNAYVGFSMKFKSKAGLVERENRNKDRVSTADIIDLAQTIGSYVFADNILNRNAYEVTTRPFLSKQEMEGTRPVLGTGTERVNAYRNPTSSFIDEVMDKYGMKADAVWEKINDDKGYTKDRINYEHFINERHGGNTEGEAKHVFEMTDKFIEVLQEKMLNDKGLIKEILHRHGDLFVNDAMAGQIENGFTMAEIGDVDL